MVGWRVTEGGHEVFWARVYQPAAERGPARLGTSGFLAWLAPALGKQGTQRLGRPSWARRSGGLDFILAVDS